MFLKRLENLVNLQILFSNFLGLYKIRWNAKKTKWEKVAPPARIHHRRIYSSRKHCFILYGLFLFANNLRLYQTLRKSQLLRSSYWVLTFIGFSPIYLDPAQCAGMLNVLLRFENINGHHCAQDRFPCTSLLKLCKVCIITVHTHLFNRY